MRHTTSVLSSPLARSNQPLSRRGLAALAIVLAVIVLASARCGRNPLSGKGISGELLDVVPVTTADGGYRLWILTDASATYIKTVRRPGYFSMGRACASCKTLVYEYDPVSSKVLAKFRNDYKTVITQAWMASVNGKVWVVTGPYHENEPRLFVYGTDPAALIDETPGIIARYHELSSGIINVRMYRDPDRLTLDTKDGRTDLILTLADGKLYPNEAAFRQATAGRDAERTTLFVLGPEESGGIRKQLYRVTGPRGKITGPFIENSVKNAQTLKYMAEASAEIVAPDRVFLDGMIFYQDAEGCLILDQNAAGRTADRSLTYVDAAGKIRWTVPQAQLFPEMRVDLDRSSATRMSSIKDDIRASRSGNILLFELKGLGFIGFDIQTGKKLWQVGS